MPGHKKHKAKEKLSPAGRRDSDIRFSCRETKGTTMEQRHNCVKRELYNLNSRRDTEESQG